MKVNLSFLGWCAIALGLVLQVSGIIIDYDQDIDLGEFASLRIALYSPEEAPFSNDSNSDNTTFVETRIQLAREQDFGQSIQALFFHSSRLNRIDGCCTAQRVQDGDCTTEELGRVITEPDASVDDPEQFVLFDVNFNFGSLQPFETRLNVTTSGVYYLRFYNCDPRDDLTNEEQRAGRVRISGNTIWLQPFGHLPGNSIPLVPLYWVMTFLYGAFLTYWVTALVIHKANLQGLQHVISLVLITGAFEQWLLALDYTVFNETGDISIAFNIIGVFTGVIKRTIGWLGLILVTQGYTVTKPDISKVQKIMIVIFLPIYVIIDFLFSLLAALASTPQTADRVPIAAVVFFVILLIVIDFSILLWLVINLMGTFLPLTTKKETERKVMYIKLIVILVVAYILSFLFFIFQLGALAADTFDQWWRGWFFWTAFWPVLQYYVAIGFALIWRPTGENDRFSYAKLDSGSTNNNVELPDVASDTSKHSSSDQDDDDDDHNDEPPPPRAQPKSPSSDSQETDSE